MIDVFSGILRSVYSFFERQNFFRFNPQRRPHKMLKHTQSICRLLPTNCLSVFDDFVGSALKGLT